MTMYRFSTTDFPSFIGIDNMLDMLEKMVDVKSPNYPPYNILKVADNQYVLEMALAGFRKDEIDVSTANNSVVITGKKSSGDDVKYIHRGIGARSFTNTFPLADNVVVKGASMEDGVLHIGLERIIPEELKSRKIEIGNSLSSISSPQLLTEEK